MSMPALPQSNPPADTVPAGPVSRGGEQDLVTLNFVNADLDGVVGAIGQYTGRTFIVDPRVRGTLTLSTPNPVPRDQAYRMLLTALRLQGFSVVEDGNYAKVVPEADAKLQSGRVDGRESTVRGDQIVTQVFRLQYESSTNMVPVLRPLISPNNTITAYAANNSLVITDYADNLRRIGRIIANIDVPAAVDLDIIPLKHAIAIDMAAAIAKLIGEGSGNQGTDPGQRITVLADQRTNSILLRAGSRARAEIARSLISKLDQPTQRGGNINVVYLKNANAVTLAGTLRSILSGEGGGSTGSAGATQTSLSSGSGIGGSGIGGGGSGGIGGSSGGGLSSSQGGLSNSSASNASFGSNNSGQQSSGGSFPGGSIQADASTNTLIITAPEPVYRNIREIIEKLDVRRAQVMIETLIVEVNTDDVAEFGVQWQALGGLNNSGTNVIGGTNFGGTGTNIIGAAQNLGSLGTGLNVGVIHGTVTIPGIGAITNLGFLARALETSGKGNILSTPNVLTLDNQQATFLAGQNVPVLTGITSGLATAGVTTNPLQSIERQDVGLTLKVKPQISEGGLVQLQIYQEQSSVQSTSAQGPTFNKRAIETSVLVDNGSIIVLGGLIQDTGSSNTDGVPGLSRIPFLGALFRYDRRERHKTNLMVFLRPYIIRDKEASNSVVVDRYDYMRLRSEESQLPDNWILPNTKAPMPAPMNENGTVPLPGPLILPDNPTGTIDQPLRTKEQREREAREKEQRLRDQREQELRERDAGKAPDTYRP
ncbi:N/A [soil metagenome]